VLSDLQGKPCSRGYQGAGGRHELVILAKHHVEAVTLYLQPQRAAFRVVGAAVVGGRCYQHRPPAACLGAVQGATLHHTGALTPLRSLRRQDHALNRSDTTLPSCTNPPVDCSSTRSQPTLRCQHPDEFCHTGNAKQDTRAVPRCR
jgi:hypothetical protein